MIDYDSINRRAFKKADEFEKALENKNVRDSRESTYVYWAKMNIELLKYNKLVIEDFELDIDFNLFKKSLEAFGITQFIYYNQSSIDLRVIINFIENGFEIVKPESFEQLNFNDKYTQKKGLLIRRKK